MISSVLWLLVLIVAIFGMLAARSQIPREHRNRIFYGIELPSMIAASSIWYGYAFTALNATSLQTFNITGFVLAAIAGLTIRLGARSSHGRAVLFVYTFLWLLTFLFGMIGVYGIDVGLKPFDILQFSLSLALVAIGPIFLWAGYRTLGSRRLYGFESRSFGY